MTELRRFLSGLESLLAMSAERIQMKPCSDVRQGLRMEFQKKKKKKKIGLTIQSSYWHDIVRHQDIIQVIYT